MSSTWSCVKHLTLSHTTSSLNWTRWMGPSVDKKRAGWWHSELQSIPRHVNGDQQRVAFLRYRNCNNHLVWWQGQWIECSLSKFPANTELCGWRAGGKGEHPDGPGQLAHLNLMEFNKAEYKVLHVSQGNPNPKHRLGREWIKSSPGEKMWGCWRTRSSTQPINVHSQPWKPDVPWAAL